MRGKSAKHTPTDTVQQQQQQRCVKRASVSTRSWNRRWFRKGAISREPARDAMNEAIVNCVTRCRPPTKGTDRCQRRREQLNIYRHARGASLKHVATDDWLFDARLYYIIFEHWPPTTSSSLISVLYCSMTSLVWWRSAALGGWSRRATMLRWDAPRPSSGCREHRLRSLALSLSSICGRGVAVWNQSIY